MPNNALQTPVRPLHRAMASDHQGGRRRFLRAVAASGASLTLAGCHRDSTSPVETLKFWAMGREAEVVGEMLPEFYREQPNIRVNIQQLPWSAAHEKLLTAFAGDALPDICQLGNTWIAEFAALRALHSPAEALTADPSLAALAETAFFPGIWSTNVVEAQARAVPWYVDTRVMFYRVDLLAEAGVTSLPTTWSQWRQAMRAVKAKVGDKRYAILLPLNEPEVLVALGLHEPDAFLNRDGTLGAFGAPAFRRAFDFYCDLFAEDLAPTLAAADIANVWTEFGRGFFSFFVTGPWNIEEFRRRLPAQMQARWMTAPLPGPDGPGYSVAGGASLAVFNSSRHRASAWKFAEFLLRPTQQVRFHALSGNLPPGPAAWQDPLLMNNPYARAFRDQLDRVRPSPMVPEWERIRTEMQQAAESVVRGGVARGVALTQLDLRVNQILSKRRWLRSARPQHNAAKAAP